MRDRAIWLAVLFLLTAVGVAPVSSGAANEPATLVGPQLLDRLRYDRGKRVGVRETSAAAASQVPAAARKKIRSLDIRAGDLGYAPATKQLYAATTPYSPTYPNSLVAIKPKGGKVLWSIELGVGIDLLAISDDGTTAYAVLDDQSVRRIDLAARRVVASFTPTIAAIADPLRPSAIAVMPGRPGTIAVSFDFRDHTGDAGIALYDDGQMRPAFVPALAVDQLFFEGDVLWANYSIYGSSTSELFELSVRSNGLLRDEEFGTRTGGFGVSLDDGLFYAATGEIVDEATRKQVARIPTGDYLHIRSHAVDPVKHKVYFAQDRGSAMVILAYDLTTRRVTDYYDGSQFGDRGRLSFRMVSCEEAGFAAASDAAITFYPHKVFKAFKPYARPEPVAENGRARVIPLPNNGLVYDETRRKMYATVGPGNPGIGNSVVEVDPFAGSVGRDVLVGSIPATVALSSDRGSLYVALWGSAAVKRLSLPDLSERIAFGLDRGPYQENAPAIQTNAQEILPLPGHPESVAVLYNYDPGYLEQYSEGVAVYDDGVRRPVYTWFSDPTPGSVEIDESGTTIYGLNNLTTAFDFMQFSITPNGVYLGARTYQVGGAFFDQLRCVDGTCYTDAGYIIDAATSTRTGILPGEFETFESRITLPDAARGKVYQIQAGFEELSINAYDIRTLERVGRFAIPGEWGDIFFFQVWDDGRQLAFSTGHEIYLVPVSLVRPT